MDTFDLLVVFKDGSELIVKDVKCCYLSTYRIKGIKHFQHKSALRVIKNSGESYINWDEIRYFGRVFDLR